LPPRAPVFADRCQAAAAAAHAFALMRFDFSLTLSRAFASRR